MSKELFVSSTPHETRVGLVEDDQLAEIYLERENEYTLAGSIYKGRVTRVLPGMQSAFVDIGLERDAFLYVSDFMEVGDQDDTEEIAVTPGIPVHLPISLEPVPSHEAAAQEEPDEVEDLVADAAGQESHAAPDGADPNRRDRDADGRGNRWRGRRRRRGRRGERVPETKYVAAEPAAPAVSEEPEYGPPAGYQPILLPGESISKYQRTTPAAAREQKPVAEAEPRNQESHDWAAEPEPPQFSAETSTQSFVIEGGHDDEPEETEGAGRHVAAEAAEHDAPEQVELETASERERDHEDEELDPHDVENAQPGDTEDTAEYPAYREQPEQSAREAEHEPEQERDQEPARQHATGPVVAPVGPPSVLEEITSPASIYASSDRMMVEEEIDDDEADLAAYVEELEEEATFDEMEEETRAAEDYRDLVAHDDAAPQHSADTADAGSFGYDSAAAEEHEEEDDEESEIEQAQSEAEALLAAEAVDNNTGEASVSVRGPSGSAGYTQRTQRSGRFDRRNRGRRGSSPSGGRRFPRRNEVHQMPQITDLLKEGQEILVQIAKEPIGKKGARITSHIALPGRFLVFMPTVNHTGVSRKIASEEERQRLKRIIMSERENGHGGFIVRTAAQGAAEEELRADIRFLKGLWSEIRTRADNGRSPALIYHDLNVVERVLRDQVTSDFSAIWVDNEQEYERILRFANRFQPALVRRVKLYTKDTPLYDQFGLNEEINKALKSKVWLKSGGYIVINQTEALVAIDVNTGKYVGKTARLEDTIVKTNVDAIKEIVRQIRLRDLGGIIVIDFIDMDERRNRQKVMQALEEELRNDRAPSKVLQFNDFGLVAITRKRVKQSLERTLGAPCPYCTGTGFVKSVQSICNEIYIEMRKLARHLDHPDVMLRVNPEVAKGLKANNARALTEMEELARKTIIVKSDPALHQEQFDIT